MKISKRDLKLLMVLGGLLIFLLLYMLVYQNFQDKADAIEREISSTLKPRAQQLESYAANLPTYQAGIEEMGAKNLETMIAYPANIQNEDTLSYLLTLEKDNKIDIKSVDFGTKTLINEFDGAIKENNEDKITTIDIYSVPTNYVGEMTYQQVKDVLDYIYATEKQSAVDSVSLSYSAETGKITGGIGLLQFYINYDGANYIPEEIPKTEYGVKDLFGTGEKKEEAKQPAEPEDNENNDDNNEEAGN